MNYFCRKLFLNLRRQTIIISKIINQCSIFRTVIFCKISRSKFYFWFIFSDTFFDCDGSSSNFISSSLHSQPHVSDNYIKTFKCRSCTYSTSNLSNFKRHVKIHTGEKPYTCNICGKSFIQKVQLDSHIRVHTGEKPFICNLCPRSFADKRCLRRHLEMHSMIQSVWISLKFCCNIAFSENSYIIKFTYILGEEE